MDKNYRSRPNIVAFVNNFNAKLSQKTVRKDNGVHVLFINETNIEKIIEKFLSLKKKYNIKDEDGEEGCRIDNLFLSRGWKCFEEIGLKLGISKISNDDHSSNFIFRDTLGCVLGAIGKNKKQLYEEYGINEIELRKFVLKLIKDIKLENYNFENIFSLQNKIVKNFNKCFNVNLKLNQNLCVEDSLKKIIRTDICQPIIGYYSTIHSAKGLEASSVLVVAENKKLLGKWLLTDKNDLGMYVNDIYRLGFVGFSRARNFLCIACLESILPDFEKTLNNFEVLIDPPFKRPQTTWDLW